MTYPTRMFAGVCSANLRRCGWLMIVVEGGQMIWVSELYGAPDRRGRGFAVYLMPAP